MEYYFRFKGYGAVIIKNKRSIFYEKQTSKIRGVYFYGKPTSKSRICATADKR
jgi:hypothetical protein